MSHLGTRLSALADGQLAPAATERALAHVAGCPQCAAELTAARAARRALAAADDVTPAPDLTARLLSLGTLPTAPGTPPSGIPQTRDPAAWIPALSPLRFNRRGCDRSPRQARRGR